jgi:hypothetical protein
VNEPSDPRSEESVNRQRGLDRDVGDEHDVRRARRRGELVAQPGRLLVAEAPDVAPAARQLDRVEHEHLPGAEPQRVVAPGQPELLQRHSLAAQRVAARPVALPAVVVADRVGDGDPDAIVDPAVRGPLGLGVRLVRVQRVVDRVAGLEDQVRAVRQPELERPLGERL